MNEHDSETIAGMLGEMGYERTDDRDGACLLIINTCSVRENADKRFFGTLGQLKHRKEDEKDLIVAVCGCMMQQKPVIDKINEKYPWVDIVFGTNNIHRLPHLINDLLNSRSLGEEKKEREVWEEAESIVEGLPAERLYKSKALVNIMYGCNNFCTYCIVPYTRGRERSRAPEDIIREVCRLAEDGVKEIMLLGQNVNSYRGEWQDAPGEGGRRVCSFAELIKEIAKTEGIERIRFMTSHPKDLSDELIETFRTCDKLCDNIHLPVQAGSDRVLKRMNRKYTRDDYLKIVRKLREAVPGITISTDIIVGFPGETEEDFNDTLSLVQEVGYDSAFTFRYSIRQGTPAEKYEDQIPEEVKHERFDRLVDIIDRTSLEKNEAYTGRIVKVLVEGESKNNSLALSGRTEGFKLVNFSVPEEPGRDITGEIVDVRITKAKTFSLEGEMVL